MKDRSRTFERLTVLCHGDVRFAAELRTHPKLALASAGLWTTDRRPGLAIALTTQGPEVVASLEEYDTNAQTREFNVQAAQAVKRVKVALAEERNSSWNRNEGPLNIILVGSDPITGCVETLVKPPGETAFGGWTMCAARSNADRRLAWSTDTEQAMLLPGTEVADREFLMQVRHGARLIEMTGDATRQLMRSISEGKTIRLRTLEERCAIARLSSRGLVVARAKSHRSTLRHALIGVSPTRAEEIRTQTQFALTHTGEHEDKSSEVVSDALGPYGTGWTEEPTDADVIMMWRGGAEDAEKTAQLGRALHSQQRAWWLIAPGPAGAVLVYGNGTQGPCLACAMGAIERGPWHLNARGSAAAMQWTQSARTVLGRELVRAAAGLARAGTTRLISSEEDAEILEDVLEADPECPVCGRPSIAAHNRHPGRLKNELTVGEHQREWTEHEETEVLEWAQNAQRSVFGIIETLARHPLEHDPNGRGAASRHRANTGEGGKERRTPPWDRNDIQGCDARCSSKHRRKRGRRQSQ